MGRQPSQRVSSTGRSSPSSTCRCLRATWAVDDRSTGFEVCRRIKRDARSARIPVIFVTALNDTTDRVKAIEAGGDDFLTKPHNRMVLGARVRSLLKLKAATDALEDSYRKLRELERCATIS
jgi:PleD family two-component response regulator